MRIYWSLNGKRRRNVLSILAAICMLIFLRWCADLLHRRPNCESIKLDAIKTKNCLLKYTEGAKSYDKPLVTWFIDAVNACSSDLHHLIGSQIKNSENGTFHFVSSKRWNSNCTSISLGIHGDLANERLIKSFMPACKFIGVDALYSVGKNFTLGNFYPVAIGSIDGYSDIEVLETNNQDGAYVKRNVYSLTLANFLTMTNVHLVDYLLINERKNLDDVFSQLSIENMHKSAKTVCQLHTKIRQPFSNGEYNETTFTSLMGSFLNDSNFVPLEIFAQEDVHIFFFDLSNENCLQKFFGCSV